MDYVEILRQIALVVASSYLIGSIPTGYIIVKLFKGEDIRTIGSGSTGATNVKRVMGKKWFFIVMLLDALKGALPVILTAQYTDALWEIGLLPVLSAIFVILGHSKSVFLNFTGGKSVASGVGTLLALNWQAGLTIAAVWAVVTWVSKYVSLGSIVALALSPLLMWFLNAPIAYIIYAVIAAIYVIWLHRENIKRLKEGNENKVRE
jgi:glycerol-3-phosphate acyltransferase PlsY